MPGHDIFLKKNQTAYFFGILKAEEDRRKKERESDRQIPREQMAHRGLDHFVFSKAPQLLGAVFRERRCAFKKGEKRMKITITTPFGENSFEVPSERVCSLLIFAAEAAEPDGRTETAAADTSGDTVGREKDGRQNS